MIQPSQLCQESPREGQTLDDPLRHLTACHRRIEERLDTLERVVPHWATRYEEALTAVRNALRFFDTNGVWHTEDEERSIFPRMQHGLSEEERGYLAELERQHDVAESAYETLRGIVGKLDTRAASSEWIGEYEAAVKKLSRLYRDHIASEDSRLVTIGARILSTAELAAISTEMKQRRGLL